MMPSNIVVSRHIIVDSFVRCCCCCQKYNSIHASPSIQRHGSKSNTNNASDQHPLNLLIDLLLLFVGCVTSASVIAVDAGCNVFISTPGIGIVTPVPNPRSVGFNDGSYVGVRDGMPRPVINAVLTVGLIVRCMPCPTFSRPKLETEGVGMGDAALAVYVGVGDKSPKSIIPSE
jgi:hypothetical protein